MPNEPEIRDYIDYPTETIVTPLKYPVGLAYALNFIYGSEKEEKSKPKLLTRFQILKGVS